jgi:hypothetical protein
MIFSKDYRVYNKSSNELCFIKSVSFDEEGNIASILLRNSNNEISYHTSFYTLVFEKIVSYDKNMHPIYVNDVVSGIIDTKKRKTPDLFVVEEIDDSSKEFYRTGNKGVLRYLNPKRTNIGYPFFENVEVVGTIHDPQFMKYDIFDLTKNTHIVDVPELANSL